MGHPVYRVNIILKSGQILTNDHDCTVYYCDTDSLLVKNKQNNNFSALLNGIFPYTEIEMKVLDRCLFVKTKTYYQWQSDRIKYGQHANGPDIWREVIEILASNSNLVNLTDIKNAFDELFHFIIREKSCNDVTQMIRINSGYKTNTPSAEYKRYIAKTHPTLTSRSKHLIYYHLVRDDVTKTRYRPYSKDVRMADVNVFKYISNVFTTIFNIIENKIKENNKPFKISLSEKN